MEELRDSYKTLGKASGEILFKNKNSKFFASAFPVTSEEEIKGHLEELKKKHHSARHWCYAWQLGKEEFRYRANDDGEPSNSAGMPIYGQIQSFGLTNVLIIVVRYFGGVKLGIGSLINAYRTSARMSLEASDIVERSIDLQYELSFAYSELNKVMRVIKENNLNLIKQEMELNCKIYISVRKSMAGPIFEKFDKTHKIDIKTYGD